MTTCWWCGAPWRCRRCGSHQQRPKSKGCAECHRRNTRARTAQHQTDADITITPAIRNYLDAFTRYLMATKTGDTALIREKAREKASALHTLERTAQ